MIKFQGTVNGRVLLGLGLSHGNLERLKAGQPIHFNAEQMGLPDIRVHDVFIFAGETEEAMREELEANGCLDGARVIEGGSRH